VPFGGKRGETKHTTWTLANAEPTCPSLAVGRFRTASRHCLACENNARLGRWLPWQLELMVGTITVACCCNTDIYWWTVHCTRIPLHSPIFLFHFLPLFIFIISLVHSVFVLRPLRLSTLVFQPFVGPLFKCSFCKDFSLTSSWRFIVVLWVLLLPYIYHWYYWNTVLQTEGWTKPPFPTVRTLHSFLIPFVLLPRSIPPRPFPVSFGWEQRPQISAVSRTTLFKRFHKLYWKWDFRFWRRRVWRSVLWDILLCSQIVVNRRFKGACCLHHHTLNFIGSVPKGCLMVVAHVK
jgi:hypothetical protein